MFTKNAQRRYTKSFRRFDKMNTIILFSHFSQFNGHSGVCHPTPPPPPSPTPNTTHSCHFLQIHFSQKLGSNNAQKAFCFMADPIMIYDKTYMNTLAWMWNCCHLRAAKTYLSKRTLLYCYNIILLIWKIIFLIVIFMIIIYEQERKMYRYFYYSCLFRCDLLERWITVVISNDIPC